MAGNVTASVVGGDLKIKGDDFSNGVVVTRIDNSTIEVRGTTWGGADTKINGTPLGRALLSGLTDDVLVDLYGGNDSIRFHGTDASRKLSVPDQLLVYTQAGNDEISFFDTYAANDILVNSGSGKDEIYGIGVATGDEFFVQEENTPVFAGDYNFVNIYGNSVIGDQLNVKFPRSNDTLKVSKTSAGSLWLEGREGNDSFFIDQVKTRLDIRIDPGIGSDTTTVQYCTLGDDLLIEEFTDSRPSANVDRVTITNTTATDYIQVRGNNSQDIVALISSKARVLYLNLFAGNDKLNVKYTTATSWLLDGGSGTDSLNRYGNSATFGSKNFNSYTYNANS